MYANVPEVKLRSNRTRLHKLGSHFLENTYICPEILQTFLHFFFVCLFSFCFSYFSERQVSYFSRKKATKKITTAPGGTMCIIFKRFCNFLAKFDITYGLKLV